MKGGRKKRSLEKGKGIEEGERGWRRKRKMEESD